MLKVYELVVEVETKSDWTVIELNGAIYEYYRIYSINGSNSSVYSCKV